MIEKFVKRYNQKFGEAAGKIGYSYRVVRPILASEPLSNEITALKASFSACEYTYEKAQTYTSDLWYGIYDATNIRVGDYFIGPYGPFFIASQMGLLPRLCVNCNRTIIIERMTQGDIVGAVGYSGLCGTDSVDYLGVTNEDGTVRYGWPASISFGGQRHKAESGLPTAAYDQIGFTILLPASLLINLVRGDIMVDDLGSRYVVEGCEVSDLGWRIYAVQVGL